MTNTTHEAPERIYLDGDVEAGDGMFPRCFENPKYASEPQVEYVRADLVQAAVAAALREAAGIASYHQDWGDAQSAILALITPDAQAALDRALADAEARGMEKAADIAKEIADQFVGYMGRIEQAIRSEAAAIRKGGESNACVSCGAPTPNDFCGFCLEEE